MQESGFFYSCLPRASVQVPTSCCMLGHLFAVCLWSDTVASTGRLDRMEASRPDDAQAAHPTGQYFCVILTWRKAYDHPQPRKSLSVLSYLASLHLSTRLTGPERVPSSRHPKASHSSRKLPSQQSMLRAPEVDMHICGKETIKSNVHKLEHTAPSSYDVYANGKPAYRFATSFGPLTS